MFDSWSPDSAHYLVQSKRDDATPGFYFMDASGRLVSRFQESGFFSHRARWAPDGKHVAFLSVPIGTKYPTAPDGWESETYRQARTVSMSLSHSQPSMTPRRRLITW
jgi:Tol biopolymer transport system component